MILETYFSHICGNDPIKHYLIKMIEKNAIGQSLLFAGPEGIGKSLFAKAFAEILLTNGSADQRKQVKAETHPDLHIYRPEGKLGMHSIDAMRQLTEEIYLVPYQAKRKVFIIHEAERMLPYSANALLKTFEEPALDCVIILLTSLPENLLPTIRSRFQTIYFQEVEKKYLVKFVQENFQKTEQEAQTIAASSKGSFVQAARLCSQKKTYYQDILLPLLAAGRFSSYGALLETVRQLTDQLEQSKKQVEEEMRQELSSHLENLTAVQKESLEKEIEGFVSVQTNRETTHLLDFILSWYRDLELIRVKGDPTFLFHKDAYNQLEQSIQQGNRLSIELVQKAISDARKALERSSSIGITLENLFLKLHFY
ncbi:DNA polymerase III subunit [Parachlamydia acanthamoebae]|uniref:DNA polymerase III subunit delta n=2 Tax=Parachlamydia acanthamoebae TaxID=83552 RepID=F8KWU8_PARAV|nr:DNA polymerase III subunit delta' [Parachlamydia acanthamoebae]KIA77884.1 DNA polymerase III subunit delta' [Parachlamydia acanthamoebae]CCB86428.1 DNA polymerase III subunit delta' [Parachlamydia acanthamoebae UV-7]